jgi:tetratricopeptide (TPR) repeat protein
MRPGAYAGALALVAVCSAVLASQAPSGHAVFEQALAKERVEGNLTEAIRLYQRVVSEFASDRALAARALMQAGLCYEKLGRDEAVPAYERLLRDFADQREPAVQASARLEVLKRTAAERAAAGPTAPLRRFVEDRGTTERGYPTRDGRSMARFNTSQRSIELVDIKSQSVRQLTKPLELGQQAFTDLEISPDGMTLAAVLRPLPGPRPARAELRLFKANEGGAGRLLYAWEVGAVPFISGWSSDHSRIWVLAASVYTARLGGNAAIMPQRLDQQPGETGSGPAFSPDNQRLGYLRDAGRRLVLHERATGAEREFPLASRLAYPTLAFCPGGRTAVVTGLGERYRQKAYRVDLERGGVEDLELTRPVHAVCLSSEIIYIQQSLDGATNVLMRRSLDTGAEAVLHESVSPNHLDRSPDGSAIAFLEMGKTEARVLAIPSRGGDAVVGHHSGGDV